MRHACNVLVLMPPEAHTVCTSTAMLVSKLSIQGQVAMCSKVLKFMTYSQQCSVEKSLLNAIVCSLHECELAGNSTCLVQIFSNTRRSI